jgi:Protein of unknown function (DUF3800)
MARLGFCDSAGLSSVQQEPDAVHSVVIVEADKQWHEIDADVTALVATLSLPDAEKRAFEFHAATLFQGDPKLHLSREERQRVQRAFLELIPKHGLPFVTGVVHKQEAEDSVKPYSFKRLGLTYEDIAFLFSIERLELFFRREMADQKVLLVSDRSDIAEVLEECVRIYRERPIPGYAAFELRFDHVLGLPLFTDSHKSWGVQLADHASFFLKRELMGKSNSHDLFQIIEAHLYDHREFPDLRLQRK